MVLHVFQLVSPQFLAIRPFACDFVSGIAHDEKYTVIYGVVECKWIQLCERSSTEFLPESGSTLRELQIELNSINFSQHVETDLAIFVQAMHLS